MEVIRRDRPQVVVTYGDDQQGYPHPDHLRVHDISVPAFERPATPTPSPRRASPGSRRSSTTRCGRGPASCETHEKFLELGLESPFGEDWFKRPSQEERITTVDRARRASADVRSDALLAHATQVDPTSPFWFGLPREVMRQIHPFDDYQLARSLVDTEIPESDLFAGLR